jgi:hypothetical protein
MTYFNLKYVCILSLCWCLNDFLLEVDRISVSVTVLAPKLKKKLSFGVVSVTVESHSRVSVTVSVTAVTSGWFRQFLVSDSPDLSALNVDVFKRYYLN